MANYYILTKIFSPVGDLKVTKTVDGTMGDHSDTFTFNISDLPADKTFTGVYSDGTASVSHLY